MKIARNLADPAPPFHRSVATIGNFDGVHRGHQRLLEHVRERATSLGGESVLVTFDPHPVEVLAPHKSPALLTTTADKLRLVEQLGIEGALVVPFDATMAAMEAEDFIRDVLVQRLDVRHLVVGPDCHFGHNRRGDPRMLEEHGSALGFTVESIDLLGEHGERISSSAIRALLHDGEARRAASLLGRPFRLTGHVVPGDKRGRTMGFPTANIEPSPRLLLPRKGVYRGQLECARGSLPCVVNVGSRPTFGGGRVLVEAHALDWDGDLYGLEVGLDFLERVRDELTFQSVEDLALQIRRDVATVKAALQDGAQ